MKHFILSLVAFAAYSCPVLSQLNVYSNGNVGIGRTTGSANAKLSIGNGTVYSNYNIDLQTETPLKSGLFNIAIDGIAKNSTALNSGRSIGLRGMAGNATTGYNYGVLGCIWGAQHGAGVFGTTSNITGVRIPGVFAGYFDGDVCVTGDLSVNGSLTGTLITPTSNNINAAKAISNCDGNESTSKKISNLNVISYYNPTPAMQTAEKDDTITTTRKPAKIEAQSITKMHYGLLAEEIESVYPELVYEYENGTKGIKYTELIPLLIQSIKELKTEIDELKHAYNTHGGQSVTGIKNTDDSPVASLGQNAPNPFDYTTDIKTFIPVSVKNAKLCIYDLNGKQIRQITIGERGEATIKLNANELQSGIYMYSLIVDDRLVNTRKMVLNR